MKQYKIFLRRDVTRNIQMEQLNHLEVVEIEAEGMYVLRIADVI